MISKGVDKEAADSLKVESAIYSVFEREQNSQSFVLINANSLFDMIIISSEEVGKGAELSELFPKNATEVLNDSLNSCIKTRLPQQAEISLESETGLKWWKIVASPIVRAEGCSKRVSVGFCDVTEKKMLEDELKASRQRYQAIVETAYAGIITVDNNYKIKIFNNAARDIFGLAEENVIGLDLSRFLPDGVRGEQSEYVDSTQGASLNVLPVYDRSVVSGLKVNGSVFPVEVTISNISVGANSEMVVVVQDVTERIRLMKELSKAASHDALTGAINRRRGTELLERELARYNRTGHVFSVAILDIDKFKSVNDKYGHAAGDKVLIEFCKCLSDTVREVDMMCRWGGEEFIVLLPETNTEGARIWAERAREAIEEAFIRIDQATYLNITASIGIASAEGDLDLNGIIAYADQALYASKDTGRNKVTVHYPTSQIRMCEGSLLENSSKVPYVA